MAINLIVKDAAIADTMEAYSHYEGKSAGLGDRFLADLQDRYDQIQSNPELFSFTDTRQMLRDVKLTSFPYVIIYGIEDRDVVIYVVHNSHKKAPKHPKNR